MVVVVKTTCAYCGAVKEIPAYYAGRYKTCGAPECVTKRRSDGGRKNAGRAHTEEEKAKIGAAFRGRPRLPEIYARTVAARKAAGPWFKAPDIGARISAGRAAGKKRDTSRERNANWRGGPEATGHRAGGAYADWRQIVLTRAGNRCEGCKSTRHVIAHHPEEWDDAPDRRLDPANGRALCRRCHSIEHGIVSNLKNS